MGEQNVRIIELNRLPFVILAWTFFCMFLLFIFCLVCAYWDEIVFWVRERLGNRNRNDAGI